MTQGVAPHTRSLLDPLLVGTGTLGATGIAAAAFHAHGLEGRVDAQAMQWWGTAVFIQLVTAPAILALLQGPRSRSVTLSAWLLLCGAVVFSGTLYAMALGAPRALGAITPGGGLLLLLGWLRIAFLPRTQA